MRGILEKIKKLSKHIPGFRSRTKINMIYSGIFYSFFVIIFILGIVCKEISLIKLAISGLTFPLILFYALDSMNNGWIKIYTKVSGDKIWLLKH